MSDRPYPDGVDCVWIASDRDCHMGVFVTAGIGPIPVHALNSDCVPVEDLEELVCSMPTVSEARLLVAVKRPDDFIDLAERGFFVYDWTDIHRTTREAIRAYEPVAVPVSPIKADILLGELASVAKAVKFAEVTFANKQLLDVCAHMTCRLK